MFQLPDKNIKMIKNLLKIVKHRHIEMLCRPYIKMNLHLFRDLKDS